MNFKELDDQARKEWKYLEETLLLGLGEISMQKVLELRTSSNHRVIAIIMEYLESENEKKKTIKKTIWSRLKGWWNYE